MKYVNLKAITLGGIVVLVLVAITLAVGSPSKPATTDIVSVVNDVRAGNVKEIEQDRDGHGGVVVYVDASKDPVRYNLPDGLTTSEAFAQAALPFSAWPPLPVADQPLSQRLSLLWRIGPILLIGGLIFFMLKRGGIGIGKSSGRRGAFDPIRAGEHTITMADVAGSGEVKEEVADIIEFLRDPERFHRIGAQIPRGVLLVGPPGTGKTLLARAVAGEARASFFSVSGSEFVELYVGVGASRARELFKRARECAPSIIFIDEIDAIGRKRGRADNSTEYDQTLNQILVEMDGFEGRSTVVVLAATNRVDILDSALLRPGRFDRKVHVELPDRAARAAILKVHARGKPVAADADLDELAARTTGLSGADLANLMNEGAILSARKGADVIGMPELLEAIDRSLAGPARHGRRFSEHEREIVAYHEAGHALVAHYLANADPVRKVSIIARGRAGGYTLIMPEEDRGLWTRPQLKDRLAALLGGYAAEETIFGDVTTGSSNDLEQVASITLSMVAKYGMGASFGLFSVGEDGSVASSLSQRTTFAAETEARELVSTAKQLALLVLATHRTELDQLAERLLAVETVEGPELIEMFGPAVTAQPARKREPIDIVPAAPRAIRQPVRQRRASRLERVVALPAAIAMNIVPRRRGKARD
jgi:cell division protease FtsH